MNNTTQINDSMIDLLKIETEAQSNNILTSLEALKNGNDTQITYSSLEKNARAIKGAAKLVNVLILIPLTEALENTFSQLKNNSRTINVSDIDIIRQTVSLINTIASLPVDKLTTPDQEITHDINQCSEKLNYLVSLKQQAKIQIEEATNNTPLIETNSNENIFSTHKKIDPNIFDLFCTELQNSIEIINSNLLNVEDNHLENSNNLEAMMRAAHSIKGAARMTGIEGVVKLSHSMENVFVAAQEKKIQLTSNSIDQLLSCNDLLIQIPSLTSTDISTWTKKRTEQLISLIDNLEAIETNKPFTLIRTLTANSINDDLNKSTSSNDNIVRVSTQRINKLVGLAGELSVSSNWIRSFSDSMLVLKRKHNDMLKQIDRLSQKLQENPDTKKEHMILSNIQHKAEEYQNEIQSRLTHLENFDRRSSNISSQINHEILSSRMRPFKDATQGYKRLVRDIAKELNKKIQLEISGEDTLIDRDILEKLDAPLNHMIRNAIDHGIETPEERRNKGKNESGIIKITALHQFGRLRIQIKDDGRGVDIENLRKKILDKNLVDANMAKKLSKPELLDFLFLPSFSTRTEVTEFSGRGVGLDIVHSALQEVRGKLHADTEIDNGMEINMELPLTLSIIRSLVVIINNERYAFPLANIQNLVTIHKSDISSFENKQFFTLNQKHIGLIHCHQILGLDKTLSNASDIPVVIIGDWNTSYGLIVDQFIGERGLALRTLSEKLGKIKDISSAAITDEGEPVLVFDTDDLIRSIQNIISNKSLYKINTKNENNLSHNKCVLVVDDSLTVREIEKKILE